MSERTKKYLVRAMAIFISAIFVIPVVITMLAYLFA